MTPNRAEAYRAALAKTAGRAFAFDGSPILTEGEQALIRSLERQDFESAFQRAVAVKQAMARLDFILSSGRP